MLVLDPWDLMGFLKGARYGFGPWFPSETSPKLSQSQPPQWNGPQGVSWSNVMPEVWLREGARAGCGVGLFYGRYCSQKTRFTMEKQPLNEDVRTFPPMEVENRVPRKMRLSLGNGHFPLPSPIKDGDFTALLWLVCQNVGLPKTTMAIGSTPGILVAYKGLVRDSQS